MGLLVVSRSGVHIVTVDVTGEPDLRIDVTDERARAARAAGLDPVGILVSSAGIVGPCVPLIETTAADWRRVLGAGVFGVVAPVRTLVPGMVERGHGATS
ncbi:MULTISPECIES: SDR family NAD(P)-dependent oxidoreductase [unclassified Streptomyces]|uniref:SDR family NAD(P)-dependent oxidoreductase n=1 Tax=unclassified Streptomyces TaxID=2593676 RepID=UPI0036EC0D3A